MCLLNYHVALDVVPKPKVRVHAPGDEKGQVEQDVTGRDGDERLSETQILFIAELVVVTPKDVDVKHGRACLGRAQRAQTDGFGPREFAASTSGIADFFFVVVIELNVFVVVRRLFGGLEVAIRVLRGADGQTNAKSFLGGRAVWNGGASHQTLFLVQNAKDR